MAKHWAAFNRTADGKIDGDTVSIHTGEIKAMRQALTQGGDYKEIEIGRNIGDDPTPPGPLPGQDPIPVIEDGADHVDGVEFPSAEVEVPESVKEKIEEGNIDGLSVSEPDRAVTKKRGPKGDTMTVGG